jgi:hypothetical protein
MNFIALVGFLMRPPMPFSSHPNSLAADKLHAFLYFGLFMSSL